MIAFSFPPNIMDPLARVGKEKLREGKPSSSMGDANRCCCDHPPLTVVKR
jgi:hypothetical protein